MHVLSGRNVFILFVHEVGMYPDIKQDLITDLKSEKSGW
jgi:hypothetical protein